MKMQSEHNLIPLLLGLGLLAMTVVTSYAQYSFQGIGDLPAGGVTSFANAVSADGSVVAGQSYGEDGAEAFRWSSGGGMVGLGDLPGGTFDSKAYAVNTDGSVIVGEGQTDYYLAFRWTSAGGMVSLGDLPGGNTWSRAEDVSADGSVVVGVGNLDLIGSPTGEAFRWTNGGGMAGLGDLPGGSSYSWAYAVSADGSVVVGFGTSDSGREAFRWTAANGMVGLGDLPGGLTTNSYADAVSADGSVVFGTSESTVGTEVFRWTAEGGMVGLGFSMGLEAVNADGSVMVGSLDNEAVIWDEVNGLRNLADLLTSNGVDLTGWTLTEATGVSADGLTIVGQGLNPGGIDEGWIATIPAPTYPMLSITATDPGQAEISWTPDTGTNWVLQESSGLATLTWTNSPSGTTNPVVVPFAGDARFYRLFLP